MGHICSRFLRWYCSIVVRSNVLFSLPPPSNAQLDTVEKKTMPGIVNRNPLLYGPGPLARKPMTGLAAGPPLRGLVVCAAQGIAFGLVGGFGYKFFVGDPGIQAIEDYYKEHPTR